VPGKRYVLLVSDSDLAGAEDELGEYLEGRFGRMKLIPLKGDPRSVIVKTTAEVAARLRGRESSIVFRGGRVRTVLTSGAVGNLKRRAAGGRSIGQVHE
jgi:hypothetical protein